MKCTSATAEILVEIQKKRMNQWKSCNVSVVNLADDSIHVYEKKNQTRIVHIDKKSSITFHVSNNYLCVEFVHTGQYLNY